MVDKLVSVIIPTVAGDHYIDQCVESVKCQTYKNIELIVVCEGLERSAQRNIGIERATGDYLMFVDSDMSLHPHLVEECISLGYDALYIPEVLMSKGFFNLLRKWERGFYDGTAIDVVRFVKARGCPRFDTTMSGPEDSDWDRRVGGSRGITKYCFYHHDNVSFWQYCKKKMYYTQSMRRFAQKWPRDKCLSIKYRCWTVFVEDGKWKQWLRYPPLAVGVLFILLVRAVIYYGKGVCNYTNYKDNTE